jgi:ribosomal protein L29
MAGLGCPGLWSLAMPPGRAQARLMTTPQDITKLQAQIDDLHAQQVDLRKQLARAQLDQWQARVENLEVQVHLEAKQATDKAFALMD